MEPPSGWIALLDLIALGAFLAAFVFAGKGGRRIYARETKFLFIFLILSTLSYNLLLFLEWSGLWGGHKILEKFSGTAIPLLWAFVFYGFLQDIARRDLRNSEARYQDLYDNAPDIFVSVDTATANIIRCNRMLETVTGYSRDELLGRPVWNIYPADLHPIVKNAFETFRTTGQVKNLETQLRCRDGRRIDVVLNASAVRDAQGHILHSRSILRDFTEKKRAEEALRESEKHVRHKLEAILSPDVDIGELELSDIIDTEMIQHLMEEFQRLTHIGIGIVDLHGNVLVGTGWQDICTKFHRINPESCRLCIESDMELSRKVSPGTFKLYRCKNNMWDIATPIMIGNKHVGNIFLGQFLFDDETPDYALFRQQARRYGFPEGEYLAALDRVPRWNRTTVNAAMSFYSAFAKIIGDMSYSNIKLANALEDRKRVEEQLRESREDLQKSNDLLRAIVEAAPVAIIGLDLEGKVRTVWNPAAETMLGWGASEVMGRSLPSVPQDKAEEFRKFRDWIRSGQTLTGVDVRRQRRDGTPIDYSIYAAPLHNAEGQIIGNIAVLVDITERKRMEQSLMMREREFRTLVDNIPDFIVRYDKSLCRTFVNAAWERASGLSASEVVTVAATDIPRTPTPVVPGYMDKLREVFENGTPQSLEFNWTNANGVDLYLEYTIVPEFDSAGNIQSVLAIGHDRTERKQSEEKMLRSEQRLRLHSEQSPLGFLEWDDQFRAIEWNTACERIFGYTRQEAIGRHAKDLILPVEVRELVDGIFHSLMHQAGGRHSINENVTKDGRLITCEWYNTTLIDKDGKPIGVASICQDITERIQAEQIRQNNLHFFESMDKVNRAIQGANDLETMMSDVLDAALSVFECDRVSLVYPCDPDAPSWSAPMERTRSEWPGVFTQGLVVPMDPEVARIFRLSRAADGPVEFGPDCQEHLPTDIAARFNIQSQMTMALYPKMGKPWNFVMHQCSHPRAWTREEKRLFGEIGRRLADGLTTLLTYRQLQESESKLREAQQMARLGHWFWDVKTGQVKWSDEVYRIFRLDPATFTPRIDSILALSPWPEDRRRAEELVRKADESREQGSYEQRFLRPDGSTGYYVSSYQGIYDDHDELIAMKGTVQDITERKEAEQEREQLIAELEAKNAELERFTYTVSHDLKSPLITTKGFIGMLKQDLAAGQEDLIAEDLQRISHAAETMERLLDELLDLSRIGRIVNPPEEVPLAELVQEVLAIVTGGEPNASHVRFEIHPGLPVVYGDRIRLREVLQNLIENSVKFRGDQSEPQIEIGHRLDKGEPVVYIRDNGIGIDPRYHDKIFGLFDKLNSDTAGTGIGLAIVKRIIEVHGGRIWVESAGAGRGSTFCFTLPGRPEREAANEI